MTHMDVFGEVTKQMLIVMVCVCSAFLVIGIMFYVLQAIGLYKTARRRGIYHAWLAWIPVGSQWVLGAISDQFQYLCRGKKKAKRHLLVWLQILYVALTFCFGFFGTYFLLQPGYGMLWSMLYGLLLGFGVLYMVFQALAYFDYFHSARPKRAVCHLVLGLLLPCCMACFVYADRKYDESMPPLAHTEATED